MDNRNDLLSIEDCYYLNEITAQLYRNVIQNEDRESALKSFLESLKTLIPFEKGEIYFCNYRKDKITYEDFIFCGWSKEDLEQYHNEEVYKMDEVLPIVSNSNPIIFRSSDVFIQSEREKTKYYQDVVKPLGMQYSVECNIFFEEEELSAISIHRSGNNADFTPKALEVIKYVRPHLINVARMYSDAKKNSNILSSNQMPVNYKIDDISYCLFDKNFHVKAHNLSNLIDEKEVEIKDVIAIIKAALNKNLGELSAHKCSSCEFKLMDKKYVVDFKATEEGYNAVIHDFTSTFAKLVLELKNKYGLSDREYEILVCVTEGLDTNEIAEQLFISVTTVKKHLLNLYKKMNISGRHQVMKLILRND